MNNQLFPGSNEQLNRLVHERLIKEAAEARKANKVLAWKRLLKRRKKNRNIHPVSSKAKQSNPKPHPTR